MMEHYLAGWKGDWTAEQMVLRKVAMMGDWKVEKRVVWKVVLKVGMMVAKMESWLACWKRKSSAARKVEPRAQLLGSLEGRVDG